MTVALAWAALRRHVLIISHTTFLVALSVCAALSVFVALSVRWLRIFALAAAQVRRLNRRLRIFALASAQVRRLNPCPRVFALASQVGRLNRWLCVFALASAQVRRLASTATVGLVGALARIANTSRPHRIAALFISPLRGLLATTLATLALAWKAALRHPLSVLCTGVLLTMSASLAAVSVPLALLLWASASLLSLATWRALEPFILGRLGCRPPGHLECERLEPALGAARVGVLVLGAAQPWLGRGIRTLVVSRALLDLLEDRALAGLLAQAASQVRAASLPGEFVVWLGNLPLLVAWCLSRGLGQLGRLLALVVGTSLVVPMVLCPGAFIRWVGRLFGAVIVGLLGSALLASGESAAGLGLLLAWAVVPGLRALLNWEARQAETAADNATFDAGQGWELLEALETLSWAESVPPPAAPLSWLCRHATPLTDRADHLWRKLARS